jgi:hypothetical protein
MSLSPSRAHHVGASLSQLQPEICRDEVMTMLQVKHLMLRVIGFPLSENC